MQRATQARLRRGLPGARPGAPSGWATCCWAWALCHGGGPVAPCRDLNPQLERSRHGPGRAARLRCFWPGDPAHDRAVDRFQPWLLTFTLSAWTTWCCRPSCPGPVPPPWPLVIFSRARLGLKPQRQTPVATITVAAGRRGACIATSYLIARARATPGAWRWAAARARLSAPRLKIRTTPSTSTEENPDEDSIARTASGPGRRCLRCLPWLRANAELLQELKGPEGPCAGPGEEAAGPRPPPRAVPAGQWGMTPEAGA